MPKEIIRGVNVDGRLHTTGMEAELEKKLSKEQIATLSDRGALSGFVSKPKTEEAATATATTETPAKKGK